MSSARRLLTIGLVAALATIGQPFPARAGARRQVADPAPASRREPPGPGRGRVEFVTGKRAYLDRGSAAGISAGLLVSLSRNGRPVPGCRVETVAPHSATCTGGRPRVGDTFPLPRLARRAEPAPGKALPPPVHEDVLRADTVAIAGADFQRVDYSGAAVFGGRESFELGAGYGGFATGSDPESGYQAQRLDGSLRFPLGASGLRLEAAFSAVRWQTRPQRVRFRPEDRSQFYLWEAEISRRDAGVETVAAVGRLWPWHAPGLTVLDGVQVGRRNRARTVEWGAYAGLLPDTIDLAPSTGAWAAGLYGAFTQGGAKSSRNGLRLARQEARLGVRRGADASLISDAEALAQLWLGALELGGGARLRLGSQGARAFALEHAHLHARTRLARAWSVLGQLRYLGSAVGQDALAGGQVPELAGGYDATFAAHFDPASWIGLGLHGGAQRERGWDGTGADGGVELRLPRLFGDAGGAWLGAEAGQGWLARRELYLQLLGRPTQRIRVVARGSASATAFRRPEPSANLHEVGGYLHLDAALARRLRIGTRALLRVPLLVRGGPPTGSSPGGAVELDLTGTF